MTMNTKTALINGPIPDETRNRLEAMGFEIVDMNEEAEKEALRRRLQVESVMRKVPDACGMPMIDIQQALRRAEAEFERHQDQKHLLPSERPRELLPFLLKTIEPMPDVRIDKTKDRYSFLDGVVSRGKGRARNQGFSKHFKH